MGTRKNNVFKLFFLILISLNKAGLEPDSIGYEMNAKYINPYTDDHIPSILNEPIFKKGFEIAEIAHLKPKQFEAYQKSLLEYWEVKNVMDTSFEEGMIEGEIKGKIEGKIEVAIALKNQNIAIDIIALSTGLTIQEIEEL